MAQFKVISLLNMVVSIGNTRPCRVKRKSGAKVSWWHKSSLGPAMGLYGFRRSGSCNMPINSGAPTHATLHSGSERR